MITIREHRPVMVDVDDTLVLWDLSAYEDNRVTVSCHGYDTVVIPHLSNIKTLIKFAKLGYTVVVWSQSGFEWAGAVVKALQLERYVTLVMSKPFYYFDDIPIEEWGLRRVYRELAAPYTSGQVSK